MQTAVTRNVSVLKHLHETALILVIVAGFLMAGYAQVLLNTESDKLDQGAYLTIGLLAREDGRLTDPYRQPLLSWLISPLASRQLDYFTWAKLASLAAGAICILLCYVIGRRVLRNGLAAATAALMLASNSFFTSNAATVMIEPLLAGLMLAVWYLGLRALATGRLRYWLLGGLATGVAFLAKETAVLWIAGWVAGAASVARFEFRRYAGLAVFLIGAMVAASPIFIHNVAATGVPFRQGNLSRVYWMDEWEQFFAVGPDAHFSLERYVETHTPADAVNRVLNSAPRLAALAVSVIAPFQALHGGARVPVWIALVGLALLIVLRRPVARAAVRNGRFVIFTGGFLVAYAVATTWFVPITFDARFVTPLLPILYIAAVAVVQEIGGAALTAQPHTRGFAKALYGTLLTLGVLAWAGQAAAEFRAEDAFTRDRVTNATQAAFVQQLGALAAGRHAVYQPSHALPIWLIEGRTQIGAVPSDLGWEGWVEYLQATEADYLVMTAELYQRRLGLFRHFFYPSWPAGSSGPLGIRALPATWEIVLSPKSIPGPFIALRLRRPVGDLGRRLKRGDAALAAGRWDEAAREYEGALGESTGMQAQILRALGQIATIQGDTDGAERRFAAAIEQEPMDPWLRMMRAENLAGRGRWREAAEEYRLAVGLGSEVLADAHAGLGWCLIQLGDTAGGVVELRRASECWPGNPWYAVLLARGLDQAGLHAEADRLFGSAPIDSVAWPFAQRWRREAAMASGRIQSGSREQTPAPAQYAGGPTILGCQVDTSEYLPNGTVRLRIQWRPPAPASQQYQVQGKLVDAAFTEWARGQVDLDRRGVPPGPWSVETELEDALDLHVLPGTPPGSYSVELAVRSLTRERWLQLDNDENKVATVELPERPWAPEELDLAAPLQAALANTLDCVGYRLDGEPRRGQALDVTLFWRASARMTTPYTVFTHLVGPDGRLWAQKDNEPAGGFYPTTRWTPGQIVRDRYSLAIPSDAPLGTYRLLTGIYDASNGQRLPSSGPSAEGADSVLVARVDLR